MFYIATNNWRPLQKQVFIQKLISSFFICLLALGITPKIILHNLVAHHRDGSLSTSSPKQTELSKAGFYCHFDDFVAESPFIATEAFRLSPPAACFYPVEQLCNSIFLPGHHSYAGLRGPPVGCISIAALLQRQHRHDTRAFAQLLLF